MHESAVTARAVSVTSARFEEIVSVMRSPVAALWCVLAFAELRLFPIIELSEPYTYSVCVNVYFLVGLPTFCSFFAFFRV